MLLNKEADRTVSHSLLTIYMYNHDKKNKFLRRYLH